MPSALLPERNDRLILAIEAKSLGAAVRADGLHLMDQVGILDQLSTAGLWVGPRSTLETLEQFRQIIPYVVLMAGSRIVCYDRTSAGGEARLHGKASIGVGGHIDFSDVVRRQNGIDLYATLEKAATREVAEEVGQASTSSREWVGLLVENDTPVSRVHIGVVGIWFINDSAVSAVEDAVDNVRLLTIAELRRNAHRLETWSAKLIAYLEQRLAQTPARRYPQSIRRAV